MVDNKAALADKRTAFLESSMTVKMYENMGFKNHLGKSILPEQIEEVKAECSKLHAVYLLQLILVASDAVSENVRNATAFSYEDDYICISKGDGKKLKQYFPPPGKGNGIYDAVIWDDFELLLDDAAFEAFKEQGISLYEVSIQGLRTYESTGVVTTTGANSSDFLSSDHLLFQQLLVHNW